MVGFAEPAEPSVKWLKDLVAAYGKPSVQNAIKKHVTSKEAAMIPTIKSAAAPAALGKGAYAVEITVPNLERDGAKVKATVHVLVMADGNQHFIGVGADKDDVVKHLLADDPSKILVLGGASMLVSGLCVLRVPEPAAHAA